MTRSERPKLGDDLPDLSRTGDRRLTRDVVIGKKVAGSAFVAQTLLQEHRLGRVEGSRQSGLAPIPRSAILLQYHLDRRRFADASS